MLIIPFLNPNKSLFLDAYSYQMEEIDAVARVLRHVIGRFETIELDRDGQDRQGRRHSIATGDVSPLEKHFGIRFQGEGSATTMMIVAPPGSGFSCKEISARGSGTGCINLSAQNQSDAIMKCALFARQNGWLGGEAKRGECGDRRRRLFGR